MHHRQLALLALAASALASCVIAPLSRTPADSLGAVSLSGYVPTKGEKIALQAMDQNTGALVTVGHATSIGPGITHTSNGTSYTMFPWSWSPSGGVLAPNYWSPQNIVGDLKTAQGHLEIVASDGGSPFATYSPGAVQAAMAAGGTLGISTAGFADGNSTVLFDQAGTGNATHGPWVNAAGMTMTPPGGFQKVAWSAGYYTVEGGKKIYALICTPTSGGPYPVVVFNHGGIDSPLTPTGGDLTGAIVSGWTTQPANATDSLGQCLDWAKRGWVFATSSYRGSSVTITSGGANFFTGHSGGSPEFCLGEVTDVLALTDLIANQAGSIAVGAPKQTVPLHINGKLLMYGYSHGGCVTYRAVEQGAPVTAFSVIEGFTDLRLSYLTARHLGVATDDAAAGSGAFQPGTTTTYQPDAAGVMGYNWRSAHYFASRGDLGLEVFKTMPILVLHGDNEIDIDPTNQVPPSANPTSLSQAALIAPDIRATSIFVGPAASAPASEPCIDGAPGAAVATLSAPNKTCPISFTVKNASDPCTNGAQWYLTACAAITLPLTPAPGALVQQHYLVVYHNMNHINGGLGILATFNGWVKHYFGPLPGCSGLVVNCATD
ncbi:MAG TPA: hypothetical protein VHZ29_02160 [Rhizomicrobium sp.]|jgi:hypothetical protein|nr:hypothetical protein [Rhizomicrobium sp.]